MDDLLFHDTFTDADGTELPNHTPDFDLVGGGWSKTPGTHNSKIFNNQATGVNSSGMVDVDDANVKITAVCYGGHRVLWARVTDSTNAIQVRLDGSHNGPRKVLIRVIDNGESTDYLSDETFDFDGEVPYTLTFTLRGKKVSARVENARVAIKTRFNRKVTTHGICHEQQNTHRVDEITIEEA